MTIQSVIQIAQDAETYAKEGGWLNAQELAHDFSEPIAAINALYWPIGSIDGEDKDVTETSQRVEVAMNLAQRLYSAHLNVYKDTHGNAYVLYNDFEEHLL